MFSVRTKRAATQERETVSVSANRIAGWEIMVAICGTVCSSCESQKERGHCFCNKCYAKLSAECQAAIKHGLKTISRALRSGLEYLESDGR